MIYNHPREKEEIMSKIRPRVFFTDLHHLARKMPNGRRFITNLLHKIWDLIDEGRAGIEENFNQTALTQCYSFSVNDCMKEDHTTRYVAEWEQQTL